MYITSSRRTVRLGLLQGVYERNLTGIVHLHTTQEGMYTVQCTVGWSDLALFAIFKKLHVSADQVYI